MGLSQRRRPSPIQIWPTRVRRQDGEDKPESPKSSDSPKSPDSSGLPSTPDSPDSPKSSGVSSPSLTESSFSTGLPPPPLETAASSQVSSQASSIAAVQSSAPPAQPVSSISVPDPIPTITSQSITSGTEVPTATTTEAIPSTLSTIRRPVTPPPNETDTPAPSSGTQPSPTDTAFLPSQSDPSRLDDESTGIGREHNQQGTILSRGAEAAAITLSIIGFIALLIGIVYFFKWRRRRQNGAPMRHTEDAFSPNNNGSLHEPETAHLNDSYRHSNPHETKSSTNSTSLFGGSPYQRPETVSTNSNPSRIRAVPSIAPPQPTPNPFADPPLSKAWDQLRGRPRSTTLTDRGSWIANPFKDPASERFDPFGELQERAREERRRYMDEMRREADEKRRMERERQADDEFAEKERYYR